MRTTNKAANPVTKKQWTPKAHRVSYQQLAGGLAAEMADCIRTGRAREFCAPFQLVIVDLQGAIVFQGEIGEDWSVRHDGRARIVRRTHFPATALLTDRSLQTRTFQIERAT
jgi:hypothetical protein